MANNKASSSADTGAGNQQYFNNFFKPQYTVSSQQDSAVIAFFETMTENIEAAKILASSVIYTSIAQGVDPMTVLDQLKSMDSDSRNRFTSLYLNFNRVGTSQLGIHLPGKNNKYIDRIISPPVSAYADGSSPERAANNARAIKDVTGTTTNGYYWIRGFADIPLQIYCDMTGLEVGSAVGGWMRFDNILVTRYANRGIDQQTKDYEPTSTAGYNASGVRNGVLRGVRWDLGPSIDVTGIRIKLIKFTNVGGQDGYYTYDGPQPNWANGAPTDSQVIDFVNTDYSLGNNITSYGWALGNGRTGTTNLIRVYKQASNVEWPPQFAGLITLGPTAFYQYDSTALSSGRYLYYYESDSVSEYNHLLEYTIWLR